MKKTLLKFAVSYLLLCTTTPRTQAQGTFANLDFEDPILPLTPVGFQVPIANALPGWSGYLGDTQTDTVFYDTVSLGAAAISFHDSQSSLVPFHAAHCVGLQASYPFNFVSAALAQLGQIPASAQSLTFYYYNVNIQVSFAGQVLPTFDLGSGGGASQYRKAGADISPFAGQTGELRFSVAQGGGNLDYIQFSSTPIPEPSGSVLLGLGFAALAWRTRRKRFA